MREATPVGSAAEALDGLIVELGAQPAHRPGEADARMGIEMAGLGIVKTFESLLPDAFTYAIHLRAGEKAPKVLETALKIRDVYEGLRLIPNKIL